MFVVIKYVRTLHRQSGYADFEYLYTNDYIAYSARNSMQLLYAQIINNMRTYRFKKKNVKQLNFKSLRFIESAYG